MKKDDENKNLNEIFERIKKVLNVGTYKDMLEKLDIKRGTFDNWKNRGAIPASQLIVIADKLGVSKEFLESGEESMVTDSGVIYGKDERVTLPYYPDIYASAGGGAYPYLQKSNPMSFSKTFLEMHLGLQNYKNLFILNTTGESMEPTLKDGSLIFVNPMENEENIRDGGIYVLLCDNVILVKRVFVDPVNKVFKLISDHPSYEDINLDAISVDVEHGCRFMGRVVGSFDRV